MPSISHSPCYYFKIRVGDYIITAANYIVAAIDLRIIWQ